jgi:hypothetical protein
VIAVTVRARRPQGIARVHGMSSPNFIGLGHFESSVVLRAHSSVRENLAVNALPAVIAIAP